MCKPNGSLVKLVDLVISTIATLVAAFAGAWYAFKLQDRDRERRIDADNIGAGNRALLMLLLQFNALFDIQKRVVNRVREHPGRFLAMRPMLELDYKQLRFDVSSLSFLLETEHREILPKLVVEEGRFHSVIQELNERSRLHLKAQPLLEKAGIVEGGKYTNEELEAALGNRLFLQLQRATDEAIEHIDQTVESLLEMGKKLRSALKDLYPKGRYPQAKFIGFGK